MKGLLSDMLLLAVNIKKVKTDCCWVKYLISGDSEFNQGLLVMIIIHGWRQLSTESKLSARANLTDRKS